jgi:hypothetical protein
VISGFRRDADEICALLGYNAASSGNPWPTFRDNVSVKKSKKSPTLLEDGTDTLSRNVGKGLPLNAALYSRRAQILLEKLSGVCSSIFGELYKSQTLRTICWRAGSNVYVETSDFGRKYFVLILTSLGCGAPCEVESKFTKYKVNLLFSVHSGLV